MGLTRQTRKVFFELKYIGEEYNETKEIFEDSKLDFNFRLEQLRPISHKKNTQENTNVSTHRQDDICDDSLKDHINSPSVPAWAKKLFHKIALKSHPDKILKLNDEHEREFLSDAYSRASDLYESENYIDLLEVAFDLNLNLGFISNEQIENIKKRIIEKKHKISEMRATFYWIWSQSSFDQQEELLKKVINDLGWNINQKDVSKVMKKRPNLRKVGNHPGRRLMHERNSKN